MKNIKCISLSLCFSIFLSLFDFAACASDLSLDISEETSFTFDGDSVTVCELGDTAYEVAVYNSSDEETEASSYTDSNGNTVYYVDDSSGGELLVTIKKAAVLMCLPEAVTEV
ncbi:MAG: hypothetical protein LUG95_09315 [Clostridiales bacterium]|nr:hypothetical protein [Clostridiales bacterium]